MKHAISRHRHYIKSSALQFNHAALLLDKAIKTRADVSDDVIRASIAARQLNARHTIISTLPRGFIRRD